LYFAVANSNACVLACCKALLGIQVHALELATAKYNAVVATQNLLYPSLSARIRVQNQKQQKENENENENLVWLMGVKHTSSPVYFYSFHIAILLILMRLVTKWV
jgi:hypothetical protein